MSEIVLTGTALGPGVTCPQFRTSNGTQISLDGINLSDVPAGQTLTLFGHWARASKCMQGRAFYVTRHEQNDD